MQNRLSKVQFIAIHAISMVSGVLFYQVHQRLNEIFGCSTVLLFAGLPVLVCGDLYQLPPVKGAPIYCCGTENIKGTPYLELWRRFKIGDTRNLVKCFGGKNWCISYVKVAATDI